MYFDKGRTRVLEACFGLISSWVLFLYLILRYFDSLFVKLKIIMIIDSNTIKIIRVYVYNLNILNS